MMKFLVSIIFLILFCNLTFANVYNSPQKLEYILEKTPKLNNIKCKFKQEKYVKNISKPIISRGDFEYIENKGVYFYTKYPIQENISYTNKDYKQINDVINAISSKKYSRLEKEFNFYFEKDKNIKIIGMKPKKNSKSYNYISSITIKLSDYIETINIEQTNGNKTLLWFIK